MKVEKQPVGQLAQDWPKPMVLGAQGASAGVNMVIALAFTASGVACRPANPQAGRDLVLLPGGMSDNSRTAQFMAQSIMSSGDQYCTCRRRGFIGKTGPHMLYAHVQEQVGKSRWSTTAEGSITYCT